MRYPSLAVAVSALLAPLTSVAAPGDLDVSFHDDGKTTVAVDLAAPFTDFLIDTVTAPDGKAYLVGSARKNGGASTTIAVKRLNPDGSIDLTYGKDGLAFIPTVAINIVPTAAVLDASGGIAVAATGMLSNFQTMILLCRFTPAGMPDHAIDIEAIGGATGCTDRLPSNGNEANADSSVSSGIALDQQGRILLAGTVSSGGKQAVVVNRLLTSFSQDDSFHPTGDNGVVVLASEKSNITSSDVAVQSNGRIIVGATTRLVGSQNQDFLVLGLKNNGDLDLSFNGIGSKTIAFDKGGNRSDTLKAIEVLPDDSIIAAGNARIDAVSNQFAAAKLTSAGTTHFGFGQQGKVVHNFCDVCVQAPLADVAVQSNGRVILAGTAKGDFFEDIGVMRLLPNGAPDTSFGAQGRVFVGFDIMDGENVVGPAKDAGASVSIQNGKIIVGGSTQVDADNLANRDYAAVRLLIN